MLNLSVLRVTISISWILICSHLFSQKIIVKSDVDFEASITTYIITPTSSLPEVELLRLKPYSEKTFQLLPESILILVSKEIGNHNSITIPILARNTIYINIVNKNGPLSFESESDSYGRFLKLYNEFIRIPQIQYLNVRDVPKKLLAGDSEIDLSRIIDSVAINTMDTYFLAGQGSALDEEGLNFVRKLIEYSIVTSLFAKLDLFISKNTSALEKSSIVKSHIRFLIDKLKIQDFESRFTNYKTTALGFYVSISKRISAKENYEDNLYFNVRDLNTLSPWFRSKTSLKDLNLIEEYFAHTLYSCINSRLSMGNECETALLFFQNYFPQSNYVRKLVDHYDKKSRLLQESRIDRKNTEIDNRKLISDNQDLEILNSEVTSSIRSLIQIDSIENAYIDIWATWCAPCLKELEHYENLDSLFIANDIEKYFISLDKESDTDFWMNFIHHNSIYGKHLFANPELRESIYKKYGNGITILIPRYILIKEGKVVSRFAPRPSERISLEREIGLHFRN